jgi:hypothetical protein
MNCPQCGKDEWQITAYTHDTVIFTIDLHDDLSFDTIDYLKEYLGETDYEDHATCMECDYELTLNSK